ncbi:MAG: TetR/AcrR family transcriptional regulator [Polyangiaceae bacterium]|nr:TetR/AcrR family transcriptional regulator [Polyangiaceae bacterium]
MPRPPKTTKKRSAYHHGDLAAALVAEALRVVEAQGHEAVSVREVARAAGVSAGAPFRHFRDRDDLLRAVSLAGARRLVALLDKAVAEAGDDPLLQFRAIGLAQIRFALKHPNLQRLMQAPGMNEPPSTATDEDRALVATLLGRARALVEAAQREGTMRAGDPAVYELAGVALVHGLSQLFLEGQLPRKGAEELAEAVLDALGKGLGRGARAASVLRESGS